MTCVLVIDDDEPLRLNIVDMLNLEDFDTIEAENGVAGVEMALQYLPDIIVCDVNMPELDGWNVLRRLQSERSTAMIPFIFLTAQADRASMRYGMQLGADDYLTKPFTSDELIGAITTRLGKYNSAVETFRERFATGLNTQTAAQVDLSVNAQALVGATIKGYQIWEMVGEGGVGVVYRADQPSIGREVAIKVLREKYARNTEFLHRFQTEAELVARLEHPHIIPLYDYWTDASRAYIVMRWLRRGSLRRSLEGAGRWGLQPVARLLDQMADGLALAHGAGILHRDLKPDNVLLDERGNAYLTDFGLAKNIAAAAFDALLGENVSGLLEAQKDLFKQQPTSTLYITEAEKMVGTPAYLPPEQIRSEPLGVHSDIYSLGITLYELLMGEPPFLGAIPEIVFKHLTDPLPSIHAQRPDVPKAVDVVIQAATAKNPNDRYADVLTLAKDFRKACGRKA